MITVRFYNMLREAMSDFKRNGYSQIRLEYWMPKLRELLDYHLDVDPESLVKYLRSLFNVKINDGKILQYHPEVTRFQLTQMRPRLQNELDKRIYAATELIKLNKAQATARTLQRFSGWASSVPDGGSSVLNVTEDAASVYKDIATIRYEKNRLEIDQGHKFIAALNQVIAVDGGAIAAIWHSHYRQPGYNYRPDHKERDDLMYLIRGSWAQNKGLVKPGAAGYLDQITQPGEEVFCRCFLQYVYSLRKLPSDMLTKKGAAKINERAN
jgi:hypothetical protein